jgi:hypothetical protein
MSTTTMLRDMVFWAVQVTTTHKIMVVIDPLSLQGQLVIVMHGQTTRSSSGMKSSFPAGFNAPCSLCNSEFG